jgi:glycosyltransferase involved in cell wall biosynthesis
MKIFYFDPNNDTPQINYPLVKKLNELGIETKFISTYNRFGTKFYHKAYPIEVDYLFFKIANKISNQKIRRILKVFTYPFYNVILLEKVIRYKPDIIHYNWLLVPLIDFIFIKIYKALKIKVILTQHDYLQHHKNRLRLFEKYVLRSVDKIICLSKFVATSLYSVGCYNVIKIDHGNSYEIEVSKVKQHIEISRHENENIRILFVGAIKPYKGIELLLEAANELINKHNIKNLSFHIKGYASKSYAPKIIKQISKLELKDYVVFTPTFLSNEQLFTEIANCDCGIMPYLRATQSGLPYIYYSFGKPIIMSNVGGLPEQCNENIAILFNPNVKALTEAVILMIKRIKNHQISKSDFTSFLAKYNWDKTVHKYIKLYKDLVYD